MFEHKRRMPCYLMADKENPGTMAESRASLLMKHQRYKLQFQADLMVKLFGKKMAKLLIFTNQRCWLLAQSRSFREARWSEILRYKSGFDSDVMNKSKILIINLSKGQVGEVNSNLLGLIAVSKLRWRPFWITCRKREKRFFYILMSFKIMPDSIATILAEARNIN